MNCPTFEDSFDKSLGDASDVKFSSNVTDIPLLINPDLSANLFAQKPADLNTHSVTKFNAMRLSVPLVSDTDKSRQYTRWEQVSTFSLSALTLEFNRIQKSIKSKFALNPKPWQVNVVADITKSKRDVVVIAGTSAGKNLPYQSIPLLTGGIILVVLPTIALMEDQVCFMFLFYAIVVLIQRSVTICLA